MDEESFHSTANVEDIESLTEKSEDKPVVRFFKKYGHIVVIIIFIISVILFIIYVSLGGLNLGSNK